MPDCIGHFLFQAVKNLQKSANLFILARLSWSDNRWSIEALNRLLRNSLRPSGTNRREESPGYIGQSAG